MSLVQVLSVGFALLVCAIPVLLLRRPDLSASPAIVRNAWIGYALRVSVLVPLFALGAAGDIWPVIAGAFGFGAGLALLGRMRLLIAGFVDEAHHRRRPATLPAFLAQACGSSVGMRVTIGLVTVVSLFGLAGAEAAALTVVVTPLVGHGATIPFFAIIIVATGLYAASADTDGVRYVSQALLGAVYVGVFGSAVFLLYLNASDLRPMPPHGAFALVALAACCVAILIYRQTKYVETPHLVPPDEMSRWRRAIGRQVRLLQRAGNVGISALATTAVVIAGLQCYFLGLPDIVQNGLAALAEAPRVPAIGCVCIAVLALTNPLIDPVSWQNAGALVRSAAPATCEDPISFRRPMRIVAGETAMIGILVAALGAIAALSTDLPPENTGMPDLVRQLMAFGHEITDIALTLLLIAIFAMASAAMGTAISTAVTIIRVDILSAARPHAYDKRDGKAGRKAVALASAIALAIAAIWIMSGVPSAGVTDARFLALTLAFACLQVSLLPLLVARLRGLTLPGAGAALAVLSGGAAAALGSIATYAAAADVLWLWLALPACLASGFLVLAVAAPRRPAVVPPG